MSASGWYHLENCTILRETERAFEVETPDGRLWLPKSQIHPDQLRDDAARLKERDRDVTITITEWLAAQKGLI